VVDGVTWFKIKDVWIPSLEGEGQTKVLQATMAGESLSEYAEKISKATGEDFKQVYQLVRQHHKRGVDSLKRKTKPDRRSAKKAS
jgi:hypothetical protein